MKSLEMIREFVKSQNLIRPLDDGDGDVINKLEKNGTEVFYVISSTMLLGGYDLVKMTSYCLYMKEDYQTKYGVENFINDFNEGYVMTYTVNHTWDIEEYGTIGFKKNGGVNGNYLVRTC